MPKMSVYLPRDLYETAKAKGDINWSQLFQKAVEDMVRPPTRQSRVFPDLERGVEGKGLRERLQAERLDLLKRGYELGLKFGLDLPYVGFQYCARMDWNPEEICGPGFLGEPVRKDFSALVDEHRAAFQKEGDHTFSGMLPHDVGLADVQEGFVDGLRRIWELALEADGDTPLDDHEINTRLLRAVEEEMAR